MCVSKSDFTEMCLVECVCGWAVGTRDLPRKTALFAGTYGCHSSGHIVHVAPNVPLVTTAHFSWVSHWGLREPVQVHVTFNLKTSPLSFPFSLLTVSRALSCPHKGLLELPCSGCLLPLGANLLLSREHPSLSPSLQAVGTGLYTIRIDHRRHWEMAPRSCHREGL